MFITEKKNAIFISLPFYRIARVTLSDIIINQLLEKADVYVISPFAENDEFTSKFSSRLKHIKFQRQHNSFFIEWLMAVSELLRINGYYYKYSEKGMNFYKRIENIEFGKDGLDKKRSFSSSLLNWMCGTLGKNRNSWKLFDYFFGDNYYKKDYIEYVAKQYQNSVLIQSSSWGGQDRAMNWIADRLNFRKVLIPYTTDQITVNGYLIGKFDTICVQGPLEYRYALSHQNVKPSNIIKLGSCWFRHIDDLRKNISTIKSYNSDDQHFNIIYAGLSLLYFPRISELKAIDAILAHIKDTSIKLIYRPVIESEEEKQGLIEMYKSNSSISFQWPEAACISLSQIPLNNPTNELSAYVESLENVKIVVMSAMTSFALDVAYISKAAIIANFYDPTGVIERRRMKNTLVDDSKNPYLPFCKVVFELEDIVHKIEEIMNNESRRVIEAIENYNEWDYDPENFKSNLNNALFES
jgi:hypothetical protein